MDIETIYRTKISAIAGVGSRRQCLRNVRF
jgi:hypothetical protein